MQQAIISVGPMIREWRVRRRRSQLDLAMDAEISQRHLSFVESGRANPSRDMVLRLSEYLDVPLRERNALLVAAGFAPIFGERPVSDPALAPAMTAVRQVLKGHEPNPAFAVDRRWNLIESNAMLSPFLSMVDDASLLAAPINVLRLCLHPRGLGSHIENLREWRDHILLRLRRQADAAPDAGLNALAHELAGYPAGPSTQPRVHVDAMLVAHILRLGVGGQTLNLLSTVSAFGTALDITLSELAIETFFAADEQTTAFLRQAKADIDRNTQ